MGLSSLINGQKLVKFVAMQPKYNIGVLGLGLGFVTPEQYFICATWFHKPPLLTQAATKNYTSS